MSKLDEKKLVKRAVDKKSFERLFGEKRSETISDSYIGLFAAMDDFLADAFEPKETLEERVKRLEKEVSKLKEKRIPSDKNQKLSEIYERFKDNLEKEHFGKIVAIDVESEQVVGVGSTVLDAYNDAKKKSPKTKFSYKRVGYSYVYRL